MVDEAKLDTARDNVNVNANRKERENHYKSKQINTDPHKRDTENVDESLSALALETVLRERLLEIIHPRRQVWVFVGVGEPDPAERYQLSAKRVNCQWNPLVDVRLRGETFWITTGVDVLWSLVHPHVVDRHDRREGQVFEIDGSEVRRNSQVDDHILGINETPNR